MLSIFYTCSAKVNFLYLFCKVDNFVLVLLIRFRYIYFKQWRYISNFTWDRWCWWSQPCPPCYNPIKNLSKKWVKKCHNLIKKLSCITTLASHDNYGHGREHQWGPLNWNHNGQTILKSLLLVDLDGMLQQILYALYFQ